MSVVEKEKWKNRWKYKKCYLFENARFHQVMMTVISARCKIEWNRQCRKERVLPACLMLNSIRLTCRIDNNKWCSKPVYVGFLCVVTPRPTRRDRRRTKVFKRFYYHVLWYSMCVRARAPASRLYITLHGRRVRGVPTTVQNRRTYAVIYSSTWKTNIKLTYGVSRPVRTIIIIKKKKNNRIKNA